MTVVHTGGTQLDGTDTLRNVERLKFADQTVEVADIPANTPADRHRGHQRRHAGRGPAR